jgi:hypothetical protein
VQRDERRLSVVVGAVPVAAQQERGTPHRITTCAEVLLERVWDELALAGLVHPAVPPSHVGVGYGTQGSGFGVVRLGTIHTNSPTS